MARTPRRRTGTAPNPGASASGGGQRRVRDNLPRPSAPPVSTGARPAPVQRRKRNPFGFLGRFKPRFVADILSELRKVTWPTLAETRYLTIVVAIVAIAVGLVLGTIDLGFGWLVERFFF
jgi:preprotein translocase subunit SecE